jgi:hypothetical protein
MKIGNPEPTPSERVRALLSRMRPGEEIDAWGAARSLSIPPLTAEHELKAATEAGLAVHNGNWFAPKETTS